MRELYSNVVCSEVKNYHNCSTCPRSSKTLSLDISLCALRSLSFSFYITLVARIERASDPLETFRCCCCCWKSESTFFLFSSTLSQFFHILSIFPLFRSPGHMQRKRNKKKLLCCVVISSEYHLSTVITWARVAAVAVTAGCRLTQKTNIFIVAVVVVVVES